MTLLKDNNYKDINVALLSLEADIKNKITGSFDTSEIDKQLAEINSRIDKINAGGGSSSSDEIEDINSKLNSNSIKIRNIEQNIEDINTQINSIEQKLSDIFSAENKVTDFNTTANSGIYYWVSDAANRPSDYGVLLVNKYDDGQNSSIWVNQIAYGTNNKIYFRQNINSGSWTEWKAVAFEGQINATLTVNGKTYNGSEAVDAGVQTVANGGTGVTTQADINKAFIGNLDVGTSDVTDGTEFVSSYASDSGFSSTDEGSLHTPYKRQFVKVWNYIKGKISSVLGLTKDNYGGKASTAGTADVLANGSGKLKFFYTYSGNSKRLLKLGTFSNGTVASFLLTVKRTDGLGFTGYLTINSNSIYSTNIKQFNGYKSSYSLYEITNGELAFLYRNDNNTNDVYIWCPSYGVVSIILMCGENPWAGSNDTAVTLTEVSGFSGTLLDKF